MSQIIKIIITLIYYVIDIHQSHLLIITISICKGYFGIICSISNIPCKYKHPLKRIKANTKLATKCQVVEKYKGKLSN